MFIEGEQSATHCTALVVAFKAGKLNRANASQPLRPAGRSPGWSFHPFWPDSKPWEQTPHRAEQWNHIAPCGLSASIDRPSRLQSIRAHEQGTSAVDAVDLTPAKANLQTRCY